MASLKNIMNTDDENVDPRSESRSIDLTSRSSSTPSYVPSLNHQTPPSLHNNRPDPPGSSKSPSVGGLPSSPKPEVNMNSRRRSNTSFESYGSSYGSSQPGPSSNTPMRPFTAGAASVEPHVKLTPITGKISKAKKGVPVHRCNQCPKTFSRAEHLRRHQLSHSPAELRCPIPNCNKPFYRKDLLDRHVQKHDQDDQDVTSGKRNSPKAPTSSRRDQNRTPVLRMPDFSDPPTSVHVNNDSAMHGQWAVRHTSGSNQNYNAPSTSDDYPIVPSDYVLEPTLPTVANTSLTSMYPEPGNMSGMSTMAAIPEDVTPELRWAENPTLSSSTSTSEFSTPSQNTRGSQFPLLIANGPWMTTPTYPTATSDMSATSLDDGTYPVTYAYDSTPPQAYPAVFNMDLPLPGYTEDTAYSTANHIPTCTVRSMSPLMAVAQSETLVAVPSLSTSEGVFGLAGCSSVPPDGSSLLRNDDLKPSLPTATSEAIPRYLELYWEKVHPTNPIIHKHTFGDVSDEDTEELEALQCAMAALATQFIPDADDRMKGAQLHAYAWQKSKVFTRGEQWSLPVQQTVALCEYYARFRGRSPRSHQSSPRFASLYHRVVNHHYTSTRSSTCGGHIAWKDWIAKESQRRLLAACFLLDVHSSRYHERQHVCTIGLDYSCPKTLPIPLTAATTKPWEAPNSHSWARLRTREDPKTISNTNLEMLSASDITSAPAFDAAILLATCSLLLQQRRTLAHVGLVEDVTDLKLHTMLIPRVFPDSAVASTYMALHHTPLYYLLSVSGKSWVFNKKVADFNIFTEHQKLFSAWCNSGAAVIATVFAARALTSFLNLQTPSKHTKGSRVENRQKQTMSSVCISDYWGVYVCSLICWAFGFTEGKSKPSIDVSAEEATQWLLSVVDLEPSELQAQSQRKRAQGIIILAREALENDCLGGGNILFADAVNVLKQLEGGT